MCKVMASLCLSPLPPPPPFHSRKHLESPSYSSSPSPPPPLNGYHSINGGALKPIVVNGNPPTFVSAPGRRIVAGLSLTARFLILFQVFVSIFGFSK